MIGEIMTEKRIDIVVGHCQECPYVDIREFVYDNVIRYRCGHPSRKVKLHLPEFPVIPSNCPLPDAGKMEKP